MPRKYLWLTLSVCAYASVALAGTVSLEGTGVGPQAFGTTSGVINVVLDLNPFDTFQNGFIGFSVHNSGIITFTDATVLNPGGRWTIASDSTGPNMTFFNAASVQSPALPAGAQDVVFARINWSAPANAVGISQLTFDISSESFVDGRLFRSTPVELDYTGIPSFVAFVPEPGTLAIGGMCWIGLALRRRND